VHHLGIEEVMFETVLVAIDEHSRGRDAIALARRLVSPDGKLIFATVHSGFSLFAKGDNGAFAAVQRAAALDLLASVITESGVDAETRVLGADRVGDGLSQIAALADADLLVLGSSHQGQHGRVWLRDAVRHALNGAPCAVAVAPLAYAELGTPITQIGIAYNGSAEARAALATGSALAMELNASTIAFEALPAPVIDGRHRRHDGAQPTVREFEDAARQRVAAETGMSACTTTGDTVRELAIFSGSVDLLIVSSRDYGPLGRLVHGSTTHKLLGYARSPMLILTRAARAREAGQAATARPMLTV
jgi:nucleotide-binding universal stress UspA family protein